MTNNQSKRAPQRPHIGTASVTAVARISLFAALMPVHALLLAGTAHASDSLTQSMQLSKAELATPEGRRAAQARAEAIAARLCREFRDTRKVDSQETYAACLHDATAMAMAQIDTAIAAAQAATQAQALAPSPELAERVAGE